MNTKVKMGLVERARYRNDVLSLQRLEGRRLFHFFIVKGLLYCTDGIGQTGLIDLIRRWRPKAVLYLTFKPAGFRDMEVDDCAQICACLPGGVVSLYCCEQQLSLDDARKVLHMTEAYFENGNLESFCGFSFEGFITAGGCLLMKGYHCLPGCELNIYR